MATYCDGPPGDVKREDSPRGFRQPAGQPVGLPFGLDTRGDAVLRVRECALGWCAVAGRRTALHASRGPGGALDSAARPGSPLPRWRATGC